MRQPERRIGVVPVGEVPEVASKVIAAHIHGYFNLHAEILPVVASPSHAYDERRLQYNAVRVLQAVKSCVSQNHEKVVGVIDADLFVPVLTYVFGEAEQGGRCAVVSLYRLKTTPNGSHSPLPLILERLAKVAIHELGHLYNLVHCMDSKCLMHFSGNLQDLDKVPLYFCRYCSILLRDKVSGRSVPT
jgi:archaemetzincin